MAVFPFTGEIEPDLPCCADVRAPPATGGVELPDAEGTENGFLVALAYVRAVAAAGTAARGDVVPLVDAVGECA